MKKLILAASLGLMASQSFAASDAGCGVGAMIFEGKEGVGPNVLAATTNGFFGNQTLGMTTGTLGCESKYDNLWAMDSYLDSNLDKVASDMSRGKGEALDGLASVMGVAQQDKHAFFKLTKDNFDSIFPSATVSRTDVVASLSAVLKSSDELAQYAPQV
jgi:hypothetical protein